jgi:hypothetical protein
MKSVADSKLCISQRRDDHHLLAMAAVLVDAVRDDELFKNE